ncbi:Tom7 protein [Saccharomycopsis crataegensis]|uniref:Tom7 protein n=1 Tax=Saccharomycopsis crataegensis TaxID=43959 RepID=A0AAV5QL44_9ASCO|nr:Tom7 protein [Saccharomycopsis crataegensis]
MANLSEESKERIVKLLDTSKTIAHYCWIPFVIYLGWKNTDAKPNLINLLSPFPAM